MGLAIHTLRHVPAGLSLLRLVAAPPVVRLAQRGARGPCSAAMAALVAVDLADGILARRIGDPVALRRQRRLDGIADLAFCAIIPLCVGRLRPEMVREERVPIALVTAAQGASVLACLARFGRLPLYHTAAYKWTSGTLGAALAGRIAGGWLSAGFRPAVALLALAHLEALAITLLLDTYRRPVVSVWTVLEKTERVSPC